MKLPAATDSLPAGIEQLARTRSNAGTNSGAPSGRLAVGIDPLRCRLPKLIPQFLYPAVSIHSFWRHKLKYAEPGNRSQQNHPVLQPIKIEETQR